MTTRNTVFAIDEFYHVYSRGVDKRKIFIDKADRIRFTRLLYLCNSGTSVVYKLTKNLSLSEIILDDKLVAVGAYCLMPNHFHLLLREITEGGIVKFISKLLTAYSSYFNKKYERTGALFGSEFKAENLDSDEYLKYIFSYIHLNPLKLMDPDWMKKTIDIDKAKIFLNNYAYSSYNNYLNISKENELIINREAFPDYFPTEQNFEREIEDWLKYSRSIQALPLE